MLTPAEKHPDWHLSLGLENVTLPYTLPRVCCHLADPALLSATYPTFGGGCRGWGFMQSR